jgi:hypothetical protein
MKNEKDDAEKLPGITFALDDFASPDDFLDFVSGDIGIDTEGVAKGFLRNETVEDLLREGWHKSAIAAVQQIAKHWLDTRSDGAGTSEQSR